MKYEMVKMTLFLVISEVNNRLPAPQLDENVIEMIVVNPTLFYLFIILAKWQDFMNFLLKL